MKLPTKPLTTTLFGLLTAAALSTANAQGDAPTFYADALPVFQKNWKTDAAGKNWIQLNWIQLNWNPV